jgi:hypothetical protein
MLGHGNDWWVSFKEFLSSLDDQVPPDFVIVVLAYRYADAEKMRALRTTILWLLGLERLNDKVVFVSTQGEKDGL